MTGMADRPNVMIIPGFNLEQARKDVMEMNGLPGYCEKHHQPWDIKCVNGQWVCECPKCRAEGLLDTYTDNKTTPLPKEQQLVR